jgi:DNA-directed RNA polymerase subunit N (RpoN/RPB10)
MVFEYPIRCTSCGNIMGDIMYDYINKLKKIANNAKFTKKEKQEEKTKLINSYGLKDYWCCNQLMITYTPYSEYIF